MESNRQQKGTSKMFQHFVPQFLLRNFSHPYVETAPNGPEAAEQHRKKGKRKAGKRESGKPFPGDPVVYSATLSRDPMELVETPVKRILGQMDMYRDTSQLLPEPDYIEHMFTQMESRVSRVFRKITKAFDEGEAGLWLSRKERNDVRKFLFLLKYRGSGFHKRFSHDTPESYDADDAEFFREYMAEKGFTRPIDVWFDNLKAIMELDMDTKGDWMKKIRERIYRYDADWFVMHTEFFYMTLCTPKDPSMEFIVTDGCYNVFEGYTQYAKDAATGEVDAVSYTSLHEFAPISPKIMIVLRSVILPSPEEDADPEIKAQREEMRAVVFDNVYGAETLKRTPLLNLPVKKAENSYTVYVDSGRRFAEGEDGTRKLDHRFLFRFFRIQREYVYKINAIFLDNAFSCAHAVFASRDSFLKTLEFYMTAEPGGTWKSVCVENGDQRLRFLQGLDALMKSMGSSKTSVWDETPMISTYHRDLHRSWLQYVHEDIKELEKDPSTPSKHFLVPYALLGGSPTVFPQDMDQVYRMWTLRVKIDAWSKGVDEDVRQRNRELLTAAYLRCPPWRVWLYMKWVKICFLVIGKPNSPGHPKTESEMQERFETVIGGTEDTIATARFLFEDKRLVNHMLHATVMNEIHMKEHPDISSWTIGSSSWQDPISLLMRTQVVFKLPGPICRCGIFEIELCALLIEAELRSRGSSIKIRGFDTTRFPEDYAIEIMTRIKVREKFTELLQGKMKPEPLEKLKSVFFEFTYPTPPTE